VISFVATVAGNFLITGSAANLIVASGAERAGYRGFTTGRHALFGIPSTMLVIATELNTMPLAATTAGAVD
jgi:Na+/H+ antiporter NhaD/arsenite permease-like protein